MLFLIIARTHVHTCGQRCAVTGPHPGDGTSADGSGSEDRGSTRRGNRSHIAPGGNPNCQYGYPHAFRPITEVDRRTGRVTLRRRAPAQGGLQCELPSGRVMNNRWILPYNPALSTFLNCHAYVERCDSPWAASYMFKYVTKGGDRMIVSSDSATILPPPGGYVYADGRPGRETVVQPPLVHIRFWYDLCLLCCWARVSPRA
jgi:hypothetical protein